MPALVLTTNVKPENEQQEREFVLEISRVAGEALGKPAKYMCVTYNYSPSLAFNNTFEPAFLLHITSLGNINPEANQMYSEKLFALLGNMLKVPGDRGYITFYDPGLENLGHQGTTFAAIFNK